MKISPPSRSLSKSTLLITPLFLCILALLSTVSEVSYLFILQFSENVASDADLNLIGSVRRSNDTEAFDNQRLLERLKANHGATNGPPGSIMDANIPIVSISEVNRWVSSHNIVRGVSPRWILPVTLGSINLDSMTMILDIQKEREVGLARRTNLQDLAAGQAAVSYEVLESLQLDIGDELPLSFQLKNIFSSGKLLEKFTDQESRSEDVPPAPPLTADLLGPLIDNVLRKYNIDYNLTDDDLQRIVELANTPLNYTLTVQQKVKPEGAWASVLHNVIVVDLKTAEAMADRFLTELIDKVLDQLTAESIPAWLLPYKYLGLKPRLSPFIASALQDYAPIVAVSFTKRSDFYRPHEKELNKQVVTLLEQIPPNIEVLALQPLYSLSLGIKYFFDSILQIFSFIAVLLYVNVMRIILKQVYDEKEVEIGVWRTLGIGGVKTFPQAPTTEESRVPVLPQKAASSEHLSQLSGRLSWKQDWLYKWQMLRNVGHFPYWLAVSSASILLFVVLKWLLIGVVAAKLHYEPISQSALEPMVVFAGVLLFSQLTCISHILSIYGNSIVESMKPFKRTFDIVRIRVVRMATFGIDPQLLMVSVMLIYYGLVSYYFIPRAVLYNNDELQTLLFNSIFFFMILGAVMLCTVLQGYLEVGVLHLLGRAFTTLKSMRSIMLKNLKAKRFTNLKISLSLALIFAFVLFFTSGINMEIKLIQSFINRGLGSDLVLENYDEGFNVSRINSYLEQHSDKVQYAWLSGGLSRKNVRLEFIDNRRADKSISCDFKVFSPSFMNASYYEYYVPDAYLQNWQYSRLPNGLNNGFDTIYNGTTSVGHYDPNDTITKIDPYNISSMGVMSGIRYGSTVAQQQIINLAVSTSAAKKLGASPGYLYKLKVRNYTSGAEFQIRSRITHVLKALEGFDMLWDRAFLSEQQANYLYASINSTVGLKYEKLLVKGRNNPREVKDVSSALLALSPEHTELSEVSFVEASFSILQTYLEWFITVLSVVMNSLSVLLLFLYTRNKCREELEMYRILRAVGTPVLRLRIMIFCEVFVRVVISVLIGIVMGIIFSVAFANQVEALLMVKMPAIELGLIAVMAAVLLLIFSGTVIYSTKDLERMTVAQMARG